MMRFGNVLINEKFVIWARFGLRGVDSDVILRIMYSCGKEISIIGGTKGEKRRLRALFMKLYKKGGDENGIKNCSA